MRPYGHRRSMADHEPAPVLCSAPISGFASTSRPTPTTAPARYRGRPLRILLTRADRRTKRPGTARKVLLSGILVCGRCETPIVSRPRAGVLRYVCNLDTGRGGCGRMYVDAARAEQRVRELVLTALDSPAMSVRLRQRRRLRSARTRPSC
jgi:recombinase-like zinc beta ribbon protein